MEIIPSLRSGSWLRGPGVVLTVILLAGMPLEKTFADELLGLYAGGAVGESQVDADARGFADGDINESHSAFKVIVGDRLISPIGVEAEYIDFGHPTGHLSGLPADATMKGAAAFGVLYIPVEVPPVDVYAKLGLANLQSTVSGTRFCTGGCPPQTLAFRVDRTNSGIAAGAGAQATFGPLAVRTEYERFNAAGGNPTLISLVVTWTFL